MTKKSEEAKNTSPEDTQTVENATVNVADNETEAPVEEGEANPQEVDKLKAEIEDLKNQNLRLYAEFENFRKRNSREMLELRSTANGEMLKAMLPVVDDFQRAMKNIEETEGNSEAFKGVTLIYHKLFETLKQKGLKPMENSVGKKFDVDMMEAITKIPAPSPDMAGKVVDEIEPGYMLGDKILRYARVVVADGEPQS